MLYAITDKFGKPFGVHNCPPKELLAYLCSLPQQGAPYAADGPSESFTQSAQNVMHRYRFLCGLIAGAAGVGTFDILLRWVL